MNFSVGDIVSLVGDGRQLVVISRLDSRLIWVRLSELLPDEAPDDMYAFRATDLRLISQAEHQRITPVVPQIVRVPEPAEVIAA